MPRMICPPHVFAQARRVTTRMLAGGCRCYFASEHWPLFMSWPRRSSILLLGANRASDRDLFAGDRKTLSLSCALLNLHFWEYTQLKLVRGVLIVTSPTAKFSGSGSFLIIVLSHDESPPKPDATATTTPCPDRTCSRSRLGRWRSLFSSVALERPYPPSFDQKRQRRHQQDKSTCVTAARHCHCHCHCHRRYYFNDGVPWRVQLSHQPSARIFLRQCKCIQLFQCVGR